MQLGYIDICWKALLNLAIGGEIVIAEKVRPENRKDFTEAVKLFIDYDAGRDKGGFYVEFSNDYSKVRKIAYPKFVLNSEA